MINDAGEYRVMRSALKFYWLMCPDKDRTHLDSLIDKLMEEGKRWDERYFIK